MEIVYHKCFYRALLKGRLCEKILSALVMHTEKKLDVKHNQIMVLSIRKALKPVRINANLLHGNQISKKELSVIFIKLVGLSMMRYTNCKKEKR